VVGREAEVDVLTRFLEEEPASVTALVLVGEAGIGKTTVWKAGLELARERGFGVLACAPTELETKLAYSAVGDLFEDSFDVMARSLPEPGRRALERALLRISDDDVRPDQRAVSVAVLAALRELTTDCPILLGIDDVQWLDGSSARVLHFALRRLESGTLRVLATTRARSSPRTVLSPDAEVLEVGPLESDAVDRLLEAHLNRRLLRSAVDRIHHVSGGNPLYALELVRAAKAQGTATLVEPRIPDSLRELVSVRLALLSPRVREALCVVAALSRPTASVVEAALDGAGGALEAAVDAGVIEADRGRLRFGHPLIRSVVYSDTPPLRRRMLHRRLARVVGEVEEQARHLALATSLPNRAVAATLDRAAASARDRGAPDAAGEFCEQALRLTFAEDTDAIVRRATAAAEHLFAVGEVDRAGELLVELGRSLPAGPLRAMTFRRLAQVRAFQSGFREAVALLQRALAEAGEDISLRAAIECELGQASHQYGALHQAHPHAQRAVQLAKGTGDAALLADARMNLASLRFHMGVADPAELADAFDWRGAEGERPGTALLHRVVYSVTWRKYSDDFDTARRELEAVAVQLRERYEEGMLAPVLFQAGALETWAGNLERAEGLAAEAWDAVDRSGQVGMRARLLYLDAMLASLRGRVDDARRAAQDGLAMASERDDRLQTIRHLATLGSLELSLGNAVAASEHLTRAREIASTSGYGEPGMFRFAADGIEALISIGELDEAEAQLAELEEQGRRLDRAWALATATRCRGLLLLAAGDHDAAVDTLEAALAAHDRLPQPIERLRTLLALGVALRLSRRKRLARQTLEGALAGFERIGAPLWAKKVRDEIARIGGRKSTATNELTAAEERVAALVAAGMSNKEIAAELFVTVRTVEGHLSHIYAKLGVRSRTQLAQRLVLPGG
jgi:DNA-binding CsgD family transcriptional regulator